MAIATVRGCEISYETRGGGAELPLVWGHGLTSSVGVASAYPLVDLTPVQASRQVVRYDARGHGLSSMLDDPSKGAWAELAQDQIAFIDHLGLDRVVIGGVSMGAGTVLHSALQLRERLDRMVLVIPPTGWDERAAQVDTYGQMARVVESRGPRALIAASRQIAPPDPFVDSSDWQDRKVGNLGGADPARLAANYRGAAHADLPDLADLATITTPTLVLAWSGDPAHPVSTAEKLAHTLPNVTVAIASSRAEFASWSTKLEAFLAD